MALSNPTEILLVHDRWATTNIINACKGLTPEQFTQKFDMGPGSLHNTIAHIIGALSGWADLMAGRPFGPRADQDGKMRTPDEFLAMLNEKADDFAKSVRSHPPDEVLARERGGKIYHFTRGAVLSHVTTHGMHHRAQCLNMLRHLGVQPLPPSSVMEWTFTE